MVKEKYPIEARKRLKDKESVTHKVFNGQKKREKKLEIETVQEEEEEEEKHEMKI